MSYLCHFNENDIFNIYIISLFCSFTGEWKPKSIKSLVEREYLAGFLTAIAELQIERKKCSKKEAKETLLQTNVNMFWAFLAVIQKGLYLIFFILRSIWLC